MRAARAARAARFAVRCANFMLLLRLLLLLLYIPPYPSLLEAADHLVECGHLDRSLACVVRARVSPPEDA